MSRAVGRGLPVVVGGVIAAVASAGIVWAESADWWPNLVLLAA